MKKIFGEAACIIGDALVVADLHMGVENELRSQGLRVPSQRVNMERRLLSLIEKTNVKRVVILGDLKHSIPKASWQEYAEVPQLVRAIEARAKVVVVKGNHDASIERLLPETEVVDSLVIGDVLLLHGHRRASRLDFSRIVVAHNHPAIEFVDELGARMREKVWLELALREEALPKLGLSKSPRITVMPAFNELIEGVPFNLEMQGQGPLLREEFVDMSEARAYLLDGTELGRLKELAQL
jgi:hypothetical protein